MRLSKVGDWSAVITPIAESYMNGKVEWFTEEPPDPDDFDVSDPNSAAPTEGTIATTPARIQHIREPRSVTNTYQWTEYRRIRVQIPSAYLALELPKGTKGRITDGGKDPMLTGLVLIVQDARNSSWAAIRTVECIVESTLAPDSGGGSSA